jgi:hypothetical protein
MDADFSYTNLTGAPVAQLDRASAYGAGGYRFESCRAHQNSTRGALPPFRLFPLAEARSYVRCAIARGAPPIDPPWEFLQSRGTGYGGAMPSDI